MEVTVKKLRKPAIVYEIAPLGNSKLAGRKIVLVLVFYADDILLLTSTLCQLQKLLAIYESVIDQLDMVLNTKKSCCLHIGQT